MSGLVNPSPSSGPTLVSHQTGLSVTATAANTMYPIGNSITVSKNGIVSITMSGHVENYNGIIGMTVTRGTTVFTFGTNSLNGSLFQNYAGNGFSTQTMTPLISQSYASSAGYAGSSPILTLDLLNSDVIQFTAGNTSAGIITYIDDVVVMIQ